MILSPLAIPLMILLPFSMHFHWALVLGLVLSVLWMSLLGLILSDIIHNRALPILN